jgi:ERO1-like protein beta
VLRAVTKLSEYLDTYSYCSGDPQQDYFTQRKVHSLLAAAQLVSPAFDESRMFDPTDPTIIGLKSEFRQRFQNVSRVMDCVGCDKCRLWGKLQTNGYGTALKVLFEFDKSDDFQLRRTEVVSLIVTLQRLSHSIWAVEQFRERILNPPIVESDFVERVVKYFRSVRFNSFGNAFDEELRAFGIALKFVLNSYIELPGNLWRMGIVFIARQWEKYVGDTTFLSKVRLEL